MRTAHRLLSAATAATLLASGAILGAASATAAASSTTLPVASPWPGPDRQMESRKASVRAKVEHPFLILKRDFGFAKTRYRGMA